MTESAHATEGTKFLRRTVIQTMMVGAAAGVTAGQTAAEPSTVEPGVAEIVIPEQRTDGYRIWIESATLPEGGFISVQDPERTSRAFDEQREGMHRWFELAVIGHSEYLEAGTHRNFVLDLEEPLETTRLYQLMAHEDTTGEETFQYVETAGAEDGAYITWGDAIDNRAVGDAVLEVTDLEPAELQFEIEVPETVIEGRELGVLFTMRNEGGAIDGFDLELTVGETAKHGQYTVRGYDSEMRRFAFETDGLAGETLAWELLIDGEPFEEGTVEVQLEATDEADGLPGFGVVASVVALGAGAAAAARSLLRDPDAE